jgi:hypothetical protein
MDMEKKPNVLIGTIIPYILTIIHLIRNFQVHGGRIRARLHFRGLCDSLMRGDRVRRLRQCASATQSATIQEELD